MKSLSPIYAYGFIILILLIFTSVGLFSDLSPQFPCGKLFIFLPVGWGVVLLAGLIYLLRQVETREKGLAIFESGGEKLVAYRDLVWVFELSNNRGPAFICAKYFDRTRQQNRLLLCIPKLFGGYEESQLVQAIRNQIQQANPAYSKAAEPAKWKVIAGMIGFALLPVLLLKLLCPGLGS